ncbi:LysM domain/ErfK/YbiS/YcfS/YnhG family protein [Klebsiella pneumoniae subsp. ozaenae]|uniref:LysM domain/ErfK/YbiS/YcfS/YnhG family protein n=1 Tax=Klebsiella pneumoniae subsp. ozaenae TaxID=574 RepID=A0A377ZVM8_KLEPO|nr:LysM domain/ErfK/YbiS/YcfS/YnhG family protein [Klebsiella pneumoniae subsp. ozaenae]
MRNRFPVTLWLTLVALVAALALPARANTWPLPRRAAGWWVRISSMWYRMTAVRWKRLPRSTMSASWPWLQANPGVDPYVPRAGSVLTIPLQTLLPDAPREGAGDKPRRTAPLLLPAGQK